MKTKKIFLFLLTALILGGVFFVFLPVRALDPLVPCKDCRICDLVVLFKNISDFVLFYLVPALATVLFVYAGFMILLGGAMPARVAAGKAIFRTTCVGLIIIFLAWLIVNTVLKTVAKDQDISDQWWKIECRQLSSSSGYTPPQVLTISGVSAINISTTSATIVWTTTKLSTSQVDYWVSLGVSRSTPADSKTVTSHSVNLTGLSPNTTYNVRVKSKDLADPNQFEAMSSVITFTTAGGGGFTNGVCGNRNRTYSKDEPCWGSYNTYCQLGTPSVSPNCPASGSSVSWKCLGSDNSVATDDADCLAKVTTSTVAAVDAECGDRATTYSDNIACWGTIYKTFCAKGTLSGPAPVCPPVGQSVNWQCKGENGGKDKDCTAKVTVASQGTAVPGTCGNRATHTYTSSEPCWGYYTDYCSSGTVLPSPGPACPASGTVSWQCVGLNGGTTVLCTGGHGSAAPSVVMISNVKFSNVTFDSAVITWNTDVPSTSQVEYGISASYGQSTTADSSLKTSHTVTLTGLNSGTLYHFRAVSTIPTYPARSSDYSFVTTSTGPLQMLTTSFKDGIKDQPYSDFALATGGVKPYIWSIFEQKLQNGLNLNAATGEISGTPTEGTSRTFGLRVSDSSSPAQKVDKYLTIRIADSATVITISGVAAGNITNNSATITWTTNIPSNSQVNYGLTSAYGSSSNLNNALQTSHQMVTTGLNPGTTYHYQAVSSVSGYTARSSPPDRTFTTTGAAVSCPKSGVNLCQPSSTSCTKPACSAHSDAIIQAANSINISGINEEALIRSIMFNESTCNVSAYNSNFDPISGKIRESCGPMQMQVSTAVTLKPQCGITADITCDWLRNSANINGIVCLGAKFLQSLAAGTCGASVRQIAAGNNGGLGACQSSEDCASDKNCEGGTVRKWECLYDDSAHTSCNTGYEETRIYAPRVLACYNNNL